MNVYDEGRILAGALRILTGAKPSADFHANYGPAQFYLVAWVLELFGRSITVSGDYDALITPPTCPTLWDQRIGH